MFFRKKVFGSSFTSAKKITMNTHINIKHGCINSVETVSTFIFRLGLEEFAQVYKDYIKRYGYNREEAQHVEKVGNIYGVDFLLNPVD